MSPRSIFVTN
uniref:Uncharacterized protein n=1 Tax=Anguilla anguilla TaxID=7936 RepID=A0A0E9TC05_ANGAN